MEKQFKFDREDLINKLYQFDLLKKTDPEDKILKEIIENLEECDDVISDTLFNFTIERLSYIDRAIIRLATYELIFTETPEAIVINEAIELTKKYTDLDDERQHKFTNSLLDNISKEVRG